MDTIATASPDRGLLLKESGYKVVPTGPYVDDLSLMFHWRQQICQPLQLVSRAKAILTNVNPSDVRFIKAIRHPRGQGTGCGFRRW